jgi:hypothetical protein
MVIGYGLAFGWPALLGSIALGAFAGALFARRRFLLAPILFLPLLYYAATSEKSERTEAHEEVAAKEFATNHPALIGLLGGASEVTLAARTKYADGSKRQVRIQSQRRQSRLGHRYGGSRPRHSEISTGMRDDRLYGAPEHQEEGLRAGCCPIGRIHGGICGACARARRKGCEPVLNFVFEA